MITSPAASAPHPSLRVTLLLGVALILVSVPAQARTLAAPADRVNRPVGGGTCANLTCHVGGSNPANRAVVISLLDTATMAAITEYVPGATYDLGLDVQEPSARKWGFEALPLAGTAMAGSFPAAINGFYQVLPPVAGLVYVTHTGVGTFPTQMGGAVWTLRWNAPATDVGAVTFYVCANAANNNGSSGLDLINCTTFVLTPLAAPVDSDGDTILDSDELLAMTDPRDADTDDDGVRDGDENPGDSDMDGRIDALECDSDGDTLPDGLEDGLDTPDPDTDLMAGCFLADADPTSTTDSTNPNSDADGGSFDACSDGDEDANSNGAVDLPDETDPNDPTDCPAPVGPFTRLRWSRADALFPIPNIDHFRSLPACTSSPDLVICVEAPFAMDRDDVVLPQTVAGSPGVLVFIQYDSDLALPGTPDIIQVVKDPASPGDVLVR